MLYGYKQFYKHDGVPRLPDPSFDDRVPYNALVAQALRARGYAVTQELTLPEWGSADIFAVRGAEMIVGECKSEKDRGLMRALGQILTYTSQLVEYGYPITRGVIFTRTEPARERIKTEIRFLNQHLPFRLQIVRVSNKTPLP